MFMAAGRMFLAFLLAKRVFVSSSSCPLWVTIKRKRILADCKLACEPIIGDLRSRPRRPKAMRTIGCEFLIT